MVCGFLVVNDFRRPIDRRRHALPLAQNRRMQLELISHTEEATHRTPILFVHGAWHGAWCWENFLPYFAHHGYAAHALSLRGHGTSEGRDHIRWHSAAKDYVADVAQIVETLDAPPVLVGHSMGGYVVQKYLEQHRAAAGVLLASVPVSGALRFAARTLVRHPWTMLMAQLRLNPYLLVGTPELAKEALLSAEISDADLQRHFARLQQESARMQVEMLVTKRPRPKKVSTPMLVVAGERDQVFSVAEEAATAEAYGTTVEVVPTAHDMMLEPNWQLVADRMLTWISATVPGTTTARRLP